MYDSLSLSLSHTHTVCVCLSVLTAICPGESGLASFTAAKDDEGGGDN